MIKVPVVFAHVFARLAMMTIWAGIFYLTVSFLKIFVPVLRTPVACILILIACSAHVSLFHGKLLLRGARFIIESNFCIPVRTISVKNDCTI